MFQVPCVDVALSLSYTAHDIGRHVFGTKWDLGRARTALRMPLNL